MRELVETLARAYNQRDDVLFDRCLHGAQEEYRRLAARSLEVLEEAREMLGVFEDHGGHDGLGGKGYLATLLHIDDLRKRCREILA